MPSETKIFSSAHTSVFLRAVGVLVLSLEQSRPRISPDVLQALDRAVTEAEERAMPLVITSASEHFAFGADLDESLAAVDDRPDVMDAALREYQRTMIRLRSAAIPVIAAVRGVAVSGGCELLMHCDRVVAHSESRIGLAESSVGVVPAGGGLKEFAMRAAASADMNASLAIAFRTVAGARIAKTALEAQRLGFLKSSDRIDADRPLEEAIDIALALQSSGYSPPRIEPSFAVGGPVLRQQLWEVEQRKLESGELTPHQLEVNRRIALILCGGDASPMCSEEALFELERRHFIELAQMPMTQARIAHLRSTGKSLIN